MYPVSPSFSPKCTWGVGSPKKELDGTPSSQEDGAKAEDSKRSGRQEVPMKIQGTREFAGLGELFLLILNCTGWWFGTWLL